MKNFDINKFKWAVYDVYSTKIIALFSNAKMAENACKPLGRYFGKYESSDDVDVWRIKR